jgi:hypothetical protein
LGSTILSLLRIAHHLQVEKHSFTTETPLGLKKFTNLVAMLRVDKEHLTKEKLKTPPTSVVISAHYDSKYFVNKKFLCFVNLLQKDFEFVASVDSAVSCALMIDLSHTLAEPLLKTVGKRTFFNLQWIILRPNSNFSVF